MNPPLSPASCHQHTASVVYFQVTVLSEGDHFGRFSVTIGGTLAIDSVQKEDAGEWICQARSTTGSAYSKARLDVKGAVNFYLITVSHNYAYLLNLLYLPLLIYAIYVNYL